MTTQQEVDDVKARQPRSCPYSSFGKAPRVDPILVLLGLPLFGSDAEAEDTPV